MKLTLKCSRCHKEVNVKDKAMDRAELARKNGGFLQISCPHCRHKQSYHINSVKAKARKSVSILAFIVLLFGTVSAFYFLQDAVFRPNTPYNILTVASILLMPSIIAGLLEKQERKVVRRFNSYFIHAKDEE